MQTCIMAIEKDDGMNRRSVLKKMATTAAVGAAGLGATTTRVAARQSVAVDQMQAESLLASHGGELLSMLSEEGLVAGIEDLPTAQSIDNGGVANGVEGTTMLVHPERPTELNVVRSVDGGTLTVTIEPDSGRSYAILEDGARSLLYDPAEGVSALDLSTEDCCYTNCSCTSTCCTDLISAIEECDTTCGPCPQGSFDTQQVYTSGSCNCVCDN